MALLFCDSFDHYTSLITKGWTDIGGNGVAGSVGSTVPLLSGPQYLQPGTDHRRGVARAVAASGSTAIAGARLYLPVVSYPGGTWLLYGFRTGATTQVDIRVSTTGAIFATRNGTTIGTTTAAGIFPLSSVCYLEVKTVIHASTGTVTVKLNGSTIIADTGLNTSASGTTWDGFAIAGGATFGAVSGLKVDDVYVCDGVDQSIAETGSPANNDLLGDVRVEALYPNGNGNSSQLVGSDGNSTDNYLLVDESGAPNTADYVESSTVSDKDTYAYTNPSATSGTVYGVQIVPYAAKTDAGTRSIVSVARVSATEVDSAAKALTATPTYYPDVRGAKPGGSSWSISDVAGAEFGVKVNA